jgi:positive regulator of sigma E activity
MPEIKLFMRVALFLSLFPIFVMFICVCCAEILNEALDENKLFMLASPAVLGFFVVCPNDDNTKTDCDGAKVHGNNY